MSPSTQSSRFFRGSVRLLIVTAIVALILIVAWQAQRPALEWIISRESGRTVSIGELMELSIGTDIRIAAGNIVVSHTPDDIIVEQVDLTLSSSALLNGKLDILSLKLRGLRLHLEAGDEPGTSDISTGEQSLPHIRTWQVNDAVLTFQVTPDAVSTAERTDYTLEVADLTGSFQPGNGMTRLELDGKLNALPLSISGSGQLGSVQSSRSATPPTRLIANWGDLQLQLSGRTGSLPLGRGMDLQVKFSAEETRQLLDALGVPELRAGRLTSETRLLDLGSTLNVQTRTSLGDFVLDLSGTTRDLQFDRFDLYFNLAGPSLFEAGAVLDYLKFDPLPFEVSGQVQRGSTRPALQGHSATIQNSQHAGTGLTLSRLRLKLAEGELTGSASLPHFPALRELTLSVDGRQVNATVIQPLLGNCALPDEPLNWQGRIHQSDDHRYAVSLDLASPLHRLNVDGHIEWQSQQMYPHLDISPTGFTLAELGSCAGLDTLPALPVSLAGTLQRSENGTGSGSDSRFTITGLTASTPDIDVEGDVAFTTGQTWTLALQLNLATGDLGQAIRSMDMLDTPFEINAIPASFSLDVSGNASQMTLAQSHLLVGEAQGQFQGKLTGPGPAKTLEMTFNLSGPDLQEVVVDRDRVGSGQQPFSFSGDISGTDNTWRIRRFDAAIARSQLSLKGSIAPGSLQLALQASGRNLENAMGPWLNYPVPALPFSLSTSVDYRQSRLQLDKLQARVGDHSLAADLLLDRPPDFSGSQGSYRMAGPSIHELLRLAGQPTTVLDRPYELTFELAGSPEALFVNDLSATLGESDLGGEATASLAQGRWRVSLDLQSDAVYLPFLFPSLVPGSPRSESPRLFSEAPVDFSLFNLADVDLAYRVDNLWSVPERGTRLDVAARIDQGQLQTQKLHWDGDSSSGDATVSLDMRNHDAASLAVDIESSRLPLLWLLAGDPAETTDPTRYRARVTSTGNSVATWMKNLSGHMIFRGGGGRIETRLLNRFFGDFLHNISSNMFGNEERNNSANVSCTAGAVSIQNGKASFEPGLVVRSDRVDIIVGGSVNLGEEQANLGILTRSRKGIGLSPARIIAPRLKVTGALKNPRLAIDSKGTAVSTGFAFFSGGLSVIAAGLLDRIVTGANNPCDSLYAEGSRLPGFRTLLE